ncbi:hypothetical protein AMATHDRAFT_150850 [Amanita thiersii Skay4041]|uniref:Oxidoreductase-like domain-containing protein n=1 Tax=Amanita thiersii Skay4041 TaxID=703135 RepID=A0A2A9NI91_9AGAR|nr:hypothetical protein AMATHDRAFT_150850 [Amanita thiersii Skay4041]
MNPGCRAEKLGRAIRHRTPRQLCSACIVTSRPRFSLPASTLSGVGDVSDPSELRTTQRRILKIKHGVRGGQNLRERYWRLERSLKGKMILEERLESVRERSEDGRGDGAKGQKGRSDAVVVFRGLEVPREPQPPGSDDCCMSGCAVCVYDLYEEAREKYNDAINGIKKKLEEMGVPKTSWPREVLGEREGKKSQKNVVMDAFEALERQLEEKRNSMCDDNSRK